MTSGIRTSGKSNFMITLLLHHHHHRHHPSVVVSGSAYLPFIADIFDGFCENNPRSVRTGPVGSEAVSIPWIPKQPSKQANKQTNELTHHRHEIRDDDGDENRFESVLGSLVSNESSSLLSSSSSFSTDRSSTASSSSSSVDEDIVPNDDRGVPTVVDGTRTRTHRNDDNRGGGRRK